MKHKLIMESWRSFLKEEGEYDASQKPKLQDLISKDYASFVAELKANIADPKFQGRVSIIDNVDDAYALGYLAVGVMDWTKSTDEDFKKASDFLRKVHKNVRQYHADGAEGAALMKSGEILLEWTWNEVAFTLSWEDDAPKTVFKRDTKEGSSTWVCGYTMMKDAPGSEQKAYDFLDAWLSDASAEYIVTEWGYGHTNKEVMASWRSILALSKSPASSATRA